MFTQREINQRRFDEDESTGWQRFKLKLESSRSVVGRPSGSFWRMEKPPPTMRTSSFVLHDAVRRCGVEKIEELKFSRRLTVEGAEQLCHPLIALPRAHKMNKLSTAHNFPAEMSNLKSKPPPPLLRYPLLLLFAPLLSVFAKC